MRDPGVHLETFSNLSLNLGGDLVRGLASLSMTKEYQDLQHLDNEENDQQHRKGEGTPPAISRRLSPRPLASAPLPPVTLTLPGV